MDSKAKILVSIVTYNNSGTIAECLDSVFAASGEADLSVTIFDNASADDTVKLIRQHYPAVEVIESETNIGFGAGQNRILLKNSQPLALVLNPDAAIRKGMIERLLRALDAHEDVAMAGPAVEYEEGWPQISFGSFPGLIADYRQSGFVRANERRDERSIARLQKMLQSSFYPDWISGSCFLAKTDVLKRAGGFDEHFFLYLEDVDLCRRLRALGMKVMVEPAAVCRHWMGASHDDYTEARVHYRRSRLLYENRHGNRIKFLLYKLLKARSINLRFDPGLKWRPEPQGR